MEVIAHGFAIGLGELEGFVFEPSRPYAGCRICGELFQSDLDRLYPKTAEEELDAYTQRQHWSLNHAKTHTANQHRLLEASGRWCTPEAAHKLAAFGVISILDLVLDDEVSSALAESSPVPKDDVEGT